MTSLQDQKKLLEDDMSRALINIAIMHSEEPIAKAEPALREMLSQVTSPKTYLMQSFYHTYLARAYYADGQYDKAQKELNEGNRKRALHSGGNVEWVKLGKEEAEKVAEVLAVVDALRNPVAGASVTPPLSQQQVTNTIDEQEHPPQSTKPSLDYDPEQYLIPSPKPWTSSTASRIGDDEVMEGLEGAAVPAVDVSEAPEVDMEQPVVAEPTVSEELAPREPSDQEPVEITVILKGVPRREGFDLVSTYLAGGSAALNNWDPLGGLELEPVDDPDASTDASTTSTWSEVLGITNEPLECKFVACYRESSTAAQRPTDEHEDEKIKTEPVEILVWEDLPSNVNRTLCCKEVKGLNDEEEETDSDFCWVRTWSVLGE